MRTIIAGSRILFKNDAPISLYDLVQLVDRAVSKSGFIPSVVLNGGACGVDYAGKCWAKTHGIPVEDYPADWKMFGMRAGYLRNKRMAEHADALIAIWDGQSRGTRHMIEIAQTIAQTKQLKVFVMDLSKIS